ncbi:hypothetical protein B296_00033099 [Ensete ventricosum]|uniref:Uncharacterized protein n=1 Tax=Ensete ventricosum TaxID=4639 RepID=A0A426YHC1_ENSVE|nr:hypothetical protein B296_00033099 [Ensete ventricosum]
MTSPIQVSLNTELDRVQGVTDFLLLDRTIEFSIKRLTPSSAPLATTHPLPSAVDPLLSLPVASSLIFQCYCLSSASSIVKDVENPFAVVGLELLDLAVTPLPDLLVLLICLTVEGRQISSCAFRLPQLHFYYNHHYRSPQPL